MHRHRNSIALARLVAGAGPFAAAALLPAALMAGTPPPAALAPEPAHQATLTFKVDSAGVRTGYDSNVYLQDQHHDEAWLNSLAAQFSLTYADNPMFRMLATYAPEAVFYEGHSTENHLTHRAALNFSGEAGQTQWELLNAATFIDGDDMGLYFQGDVPAVGGVPLRERRDAAVYRNSFKLTHRIGRMFIRPVATFYHHDFQTQQQSGNIRPGFIYENYIDREEYNGGVDFGYEAWDKLWLVAGVRVGKQHQYELLGRSSPYGNDYWRLLFGVEGNPTPWLKLNILAGPDFRSYDHATPAGFDRDQDYFYFNASVTISPTPRDTITLGAVQFLQPSYTSHSIYEDIVYEITYRRKVDDRFTASLGFKAYGAEWRPPVARKDWIFTPSLSLTYTHDAHLSADLSYLYDWVDSRIPDTDIREYTRHLVWLGLKYTF